ncbi:type I phosphodiesterase/nucleotide pyrophosphatase [Thiohalobacter thiocyanaticus]|uniref:Type I phosphodiesterase/nucleotide pyrophosphatase n=1 Tax=Thiohalobacter thiocyanaticus TaxID=585455 RepID=A0A1Z4VTN2_9GAMM|nr:alkaline phosphatase family protein [Thiohalobacter thiocyanaticus]BAZ94997.1 type I phosphodiesterase/nucleotide pyrophosphatase [Thiohalobacter thiocyanaticus]
MIKPDYHGGSLVNLMQSLRAALGTGGSDACLPLTGLDLKELAAARHILLVVIDGLGENVLRQFPDSSLARASRRILTSVFPTTTASAITSLLTGRPPRQHAVTGWFQWLREAGVVATILPFVTRAGGVDLRKLGLSVPQVIDTRPFLADVERTCRAWLPEAIVNSPYSTTLTAPAVRTGYASLERLGEGLVQQLRLQPEPSLTWIYWPELDSCIHHEGVASPATAVLFEALDEWWVGLTRELAGTDSLVLLTADHGHIDTAADRHVRLEQHPELRDCLTLPLCGEPRAASCYVRPRARQRFEDYVTTQLAGYCTLLPAADLVAQGWLGPGESHPELDSRLGDYVLLMKDNYVIKDTLGDERPFSFAGVHSGASREEMEVPLIVQPCG